MTPNLKFLTHPRVASLPELSWVGSEMRENVAPPLTLSSAALDRTMMTPINSAARANRTRGAGSLAPRSIIEARQRRNASMMSFNNARPGVVLGQGAPNATVTGGSFAFW